MIEMIKDFVTSIMDDHLINQYPLSLTTDKTV